jgi:sugar phosphate isomerase/epimerase
MSLKTPPIGYALRTTSTSMDAIASGLAEAETLGVDLVELPLFAIDVIVGGRIRRETMDGLKHACAGREVGLSVHGPIAINLLDDPARLPRHMDVLSASIEITAELGARTCVMHTGHCPAAPDDALDAAYERQREALRRAGELAAQHDVTIAVETLPMDHARRHTALPSRLAQELAAVGHPNIRCCLDFSHAFINATFHGRALLDEIRPLAPHVAHLHMHDSFGRPNDIATISRAERIAYGLGDLHLPLGWGDMNWPDIWAQLTFPDDVVMMLELPMEHWNELGASLSLMRAFSSQIRLAGTMVG